MNSLLYGLAVAVLAISKPAVQTSDVSVRVNGAQVRFQAAQPVVWYTRLLVPLKDVVDELGGGTRWNSRTNSLKVTIGGRTAHLKIGKQVASLDDREIWLEVAPRTVDGTTLVPLSFFKEAFGAEVAWNGKTRVATLDMASRRRGGARSASLDERADRRNTTDQEFDDPRNTSDWQKYRSMLSGGADDSRLTADYDRYLAEQDFRRYQSDRAAWVQSYQTYRDGLTSAGNRMELEPSANYMQYLRDRDFELYSDNLPGWRINYQAFTRWRRAMSTAQASPAYQRYRQDSTSLVSRMDRLHRTSGSDGRTGAPGTGSTQGNPPP